jgi:hypothetical protein
MSRFSPWGGLGEPGKACVKCGGKETTLGLTPPRGGLRQKTQWRLGLHDTIRVAHVVVITMSNIMWTASAPVLTYESPHVLLM